MFCIAAGNVFDGIRLLGTFETTDDAAEWVATEMKSEEYHIVQILPAGERDQVEE